jgi:acyl-CoA thioesterase YciA
MELISTHMVMTKDLGVRGNLFGGTFLSWIDLAAGIYVSKKIKSPNVVSYRISEFVFRKPAKVNDLINIYGQIVALGNTSMTINVEIKKMEVGSGNEELICSTRIVMVHIDEFGRKAPIDKALVTGLPKDVFFE